MNLVLMEPGEVAADGTVRLDGRRAEHLLHVLGARPGQVLRVGILNGPLGSGVVEEMRDSAVALRCTFDRPALPPTGVSLLLALPRPKVLRRLWAPLASLGVERIVLTNAAKVEREYFDTHWLDPANYGPLLLEGLEQSGDTRLPEVHIERRLKPLVEDSLVSLSPRGPRLMAHPRAGVPMGSVVRERGEPVLLAVGPEGGWTDYETDLLTRHGFTSVSLGERTLRSDTACVALVAMLIGPASRPA
jgi:RsmE family RNA methyltransferase